MQENKNHLKKDTLLNEKKVPGIRCEDCNDSVTSMLEKPENYNKSI